MSNKLFKDAVFYWQEDPVYIDPQLRSPIAYSAAHFPGSRSKVHGWINRYPQVYLYVMGHPKTDSIPPSQITDLEAFEQDDKIFLDWSAPGDNKNEGIAARYQIKYSTKNISSELDWLQADHVEGEPAPDKYAGIQKFVIERLKPGKTYYFAIRTYDKENNQSAISNAAAVKLE